MARGKNKMSDTPDIDPDADGLEEGRLPPSDISHLGSSTGFDLDGLSPEELLSLIELAIARLPVNKLGAVRDFAEQKRLENLEKAKTTLLKDFRDKLAALDLTLDDVIPSSTSSPPPPSGRKARSDAGKPLPVKYISPDGQLRWSGRGRKPKWVTQLEAEGHNIEEFRVSEEAAQ
jgi:DNA-binding protein H-NS